MEVIVGAAVLLLVIASVLTVLDRSSGAVTANKGRTVAASLAQEDQERLKGLPVTALSNLRETRTVTVAGAPYTVASRAEWVSDEAGKALSCTTSGSADYIQLSSTVTSDSVVGRQVAPVRLDSIVAPPVGAYGNDTGTLAVKVTNRAGEPVRNAGVTISGAGGGSMTTNDAGCAVFGKVPAGGYQVKLAELGWTGVAGTSAVTVPATVAAGKLTTAPVLYDRASQITVAFDTKVGGAAAQPATATALTAANAAIQPAGIRVFQPTPAGPRTTIDAAPLYPFADGYALFSGSCAANDPSRYVTGYFSAAPGFFIPTPGAPAPPVTVREPALNFQVVRGGNRATAPVYSNPQSHVVITPEDPGCTEKITQAPLSAAGGLSEPGVPFGTYRICVDDGQRRSTVTGVANTNPDGLAIDGDGTPALKIWINTAGGRNGVCS
jgi:hypothetical protein